MANKLFDGLTEKSSIEDDGYFLVHKNGLAYKIKASVIKSHISRLTKILLNENQSDYFQFLNGNAIEINDSAIADVNKLLTSLGEPILASDGSRLILS